VPNHHLTGDHQSKNAAVYMAADAALVIDPRSLSPNVLADNVLKIVENEKLREKLKQNLHKFAKKDALAQMVTMILEVAK
jgi:UDP-N-acetylglucosamine:LPS N-acetylglucosamine transferase